MKALSIRQPWAWLIIHGGKDIENRSWSTLLRGRVLVHAAKGMTRAEYNEARDWAASFGIEVPAFKALERGGIIGAVEISGCVTESRSAWFFGRYGFVLRDPVALPFRPYRGQLGFFDVPEIEMLICRRSDRAMLNTPAGQELVSKAAAALRKSEDHSNV